MILRWQSSICSCQVSKLYNAEHGSYSACCAEHESWLLIVGSQELRKTKTDIDRVLSQGVPKSFDSSLKRFGARECTSFHRPEETRYDSKAISAEMAFYLSETFGRRCDIDTCSDPIRFADYLANKAVRGLTEKMWREDHFKRYELIGLDGMRRFEQESKYIWPEELVAGGEMTRKEAEAMFCCVLNDDLLDHFLEDRDDISKQN